jgi:glycosyltransferase involved in cell wall biosynthesis
VPEILGQSDIFVFSTTRQEGLGTVLLEAMAAGLPVIASDVPACREVLADGRWGALVAPGDAGALAAAVIAGARDRAPADSRERIDHLQRFAPARMIAAYRAAVP